MFFTMTHWGDPVVDLGSHGGLIGLKQVHLGVLLQPTGLRIVDFAR